MLSSVQLAEFPWKKADWTHCPKTFVNYKREAHVQKDDINDFIDAQVRKISRQTGLPYQTVRRIIKEANIPFFNSVERLFQSDKWNFSPTDPEFIALQQLLVIPDIGSPACRVHHLLSLFHSLPDAEKLLFLTELGQYQVSVHPVNHE